MTSGPQVIGPSLLEESPCLSLHAHSVMQSLPDSFMKGCGRAWCTADTAVTATDKKDTEDSAFCLHPSWIALSPRPLVWLALGTLDTCYYSFHKAKVKLVTRAKTVWFIGWCEGSTGLFSSWLRWDREVEPPPPGKVSPSQDLRTSPVLCLRDVLVMPPGLSVFHRNSIV